MRLCRCGAIIKKGLCEKCKPSPDASRGTTAQRGYDHHWRRLSERVRDRAENATCRVCVAKGKLITPATELHHIEKIKDAPHKRLDPSNTIAVCRDCHVEIEGMGPTELASFLKHLEDEAA